MVPKNIFLSRERVINSTRGTLEEISVQGLQPGTSYRVRVVAQAAEVSSSRSKYFYELWLIFSPATLGPGLLVAGGVGADAAGGAAAGPAQQPHGAAHLGLLHPGDVGPAQPAPGGRPQVQAVPQTRGELASISRPILCTDGGYYEDWR